MKIQCVDTPRTPRLSVLVDPKILSPLGINDFNGLFKVLFFLAVADKIADPKQSKGGDENRPEKSSRTARTAWWFSSRC